MFGSIIKYFCYLILALSSIFFGELSEHLLSSEIKIAPAIFGSVYVLAVVIAFLGLRLNQTRIFWSSLVIGGFFYLERSWQFNTLIFRSVIELSTPWIFVAIYLIRESIIFSKRTLMRFLLSIGVIFFFYVLQFYQNDTFVLLRESTLLFIPYSSLAALVILSINAIFFLDTKGKSFSVGLILANLSLIYLLRWNHAELYETLLYIGALAPMLVLLHIVYLQYWRMAYRDQLTGISNRRALDEALEGISGLYTLGMIDIDHFKKFNDSFGHDEGDNVLRLTGKLLYEVFGKNVYRYGGEEFCVLLRGVTAKEGKPLAETARTTLENRDFYIRQTKGKRKVSKKGRGPLGKKVQITISIGLAHSTSEAKLPAQVLKYADTALYKAKKLGRNRVEIKG